ncbi:tetratricopeptide repeat protein [Deinococcus fonticola]|uniref:tetratricopeptide repeat protein n=1 Tax=Deinococcus fonticola TaxID=2528713 RepID=UPI0010758CCA|nr:tetratricopeptide repeat protein [Deinococcus fonticola]
MNSAVATSKPPPVLTVQLVKDTFTLCLAHEPLALPHKWVIFYTLLAVNHNRHISTDEVCDHHPWSRLTPDIAGRDLWRFTRKHEERYFGRRVTHSPTRQATKLFTLLPEVTAHLTFYPDQATVSDHLRSLRQHRNQVAMQLSECTLLLQGGLISQALGRLQHLRTQPLNINDLAHTETLITMCLHELHGAEGTAGQVPVLQHLLRASGLNRLNRARLLIRLARQATLSAQYAEAHGYFEQLRQALLPEDGVEYCWYHVNYGLYLRRTGHLQEAMHHQRLAHDTAQIAQWWHGVFAASYNMAMMHLSAHEQAPPAGKPRHLTQAFDWAMRAYSTAVLTRQPVALADTSVLLGLIEGRRGHLPEARHWLRHSQYRLPDTGEHYPSDQVVYAELARIESTAGNHFLAQWASETAERHEALHPFPDVTP